MEARAFPVGHTGSCVAEKPHVLGRNPLVSVGLVINKVTHACNLHCTYCNQRHPPQSPSDGFMSLDTFLAAADAVLRHTRERRVRWIFHGGEPLLLGADWLGKAMEHARRRASEAGIQITFGIQTNGTLLDPESASLVRRFGVRLGVSLDGPPEINDHTRGQTAELLRNLMMLRQMGIRCGAICVLSQSNVGRMSEVLRFFSDIGLRSLKFNSCCESGPNLPSPLGAEDLFRAKVEILDQMRASPRPVRDDNLIRMLEKYFAAPGDKRAEGGICAAAVCGAGRRVVGLGPEGSFYPCGRADGDGQTRLGSVTNGGLNPQTWKEALDRFHSARPYLDQCGGCAARKICSFGCAAYEKLDPEFFRRECLWTRMLFDHLRLHEDEARHVFTVTKRRNGIPHARMPSQEGGVKMAATKTHLVQTKFLTVFNPPNSSEIHLKVSFGKLRPLHRTACRVAKDWVDKLRPVLSPGVVPEVKRHYARAIVVHLKNLATTPAENAVKNWQTLLLDEVFEKAGKRPTS